MNCVYVYNPTSGKQKNSKLKDYIISKLQEKFDVVDCRPTQKQGDAGKFAKEACGKYDVIVVSGGDGTMNEVINGLAEMENRPKIAYIPTGTTNDLAHSLKIPKNVKKAVKIILTGKTIKHDIFKVNDKYGIYVCCFGLFTSSSYKTSQKSKKHLGRLAYFTSGAKELFTSKPFGLVLKYKNNILSGSFVLGIITNSRYVAGYKIDKTATVDDGYVNIVLVKTTLKKHISLSSLLRVFRLFLFGMKNVARNKKCIILKLDEFSVALPEKTVINLDGEKGFYGSFNFKVLKQQVEIFVK